MNENISTPAEIDEKRDIESRRRFLKNLAYGSMLALSGCGAETTAVREARWQGDGARAKSKSWHSGSYGSKTLSFEHTHTGEKLKLTYFERGNYIKDALREIDYLLRDFRTDDIHPIDTALLDQLFGLRQTLETHKPFQVISAYRSPFTNGQLRKYSHGVAEHSFHLHGRAIDIRVEGVSTRTIRNAALAQARGGVGYYPRSNFVHLDTGNLRTW